VLASRLGYAAINALRTGKTQLMAGVIKNEVVFTPFNKVIKGESPISSDLKDMINILSI